MPQLLLCIVTRRRAHADCRVAREHRLGGRRIGAHINGVARIDRHVDGGGGVGLPVYLRQRHRAPHTLLLTQAQWLDRNVGYRTNTAEKLDHVLVNALESVPVALRDGSAVAPCKKT